MNQTEDLFSDQKYTRKKRMRYIPYIHILLIESTMNTDFIKSCDIIISGEQGAKK